jgi:hypothetical protein
MHARTENYKLIKKILICFDVGMPIGEQNTDIIKTLKKSTHT